MIHIQHKEDCCGCNACVQQCPQQCITMDYDDEGFLYPKVDEALCTNCGACEKVCPWLNVANETAANTPPLSHLQTYAAKSNNEDERMQSSSGGMFVLLARKTIESGGVVFGAVYDDDWQVHHVAAQTMDEVKPMMGSKYVQSRIENTYEEARQFLRAGRQVLFSGTSCQMAGLRSYLRRDYDNLLAVDVICHGAPSPGVWARYLEEVKEKAAPRAAAGKNTVLSLSLEDMPLIEGISFRDKYQSGWKKYCFVVRQTSASKADKNSVLLSNKYYENPFMRGFLANIYLRPSCYACRAKGGRCGSDITLADFWGIDTLLPTMDDDRGTSLLITHTSRGAAALSAITPLLTLAPVPAADALCHNPSYSRSVAQPSCRPQFFASFRRGTPVTQLVDRLLYVPQWRLVAGRIKGKVMRAVKWIISDTN